MHGQQNIYKKKIDIKYLGYEGRKSAIYSKPRPKKTDSLAVHEPSVILLTYKHSYYAK